MVLARRQRTVRRVYPAQRTSANSSECGAGFIAQESDELLALARLLDRSGRLRESGDPTAFGRGLNSVQRGLLAYLITAERREESDKFDANFRATIFANDRELYSEMFGEKAKERQSREAIEGEIEWIVPESREDLEALLTELNLEIEPESDS